MIDRTIGLGGSDASTIWRGISSEISQLFKIKLGIIEPEDLSNNFRVQLGILTEDINLEWFVNHSGYFDKKTMNLIKQHEVEQLNYTYPRYAHIDGYIRMNIKGEQIKTTFVECKHTNPSVDAWTKSRYYMPQLQFYMDILNLPYCYVSIIRGNEEPEVLEISADKDYQTRLNIKCKKFWEMIRKEKLELKDYQAMTQYEDDTELENKVRINGMLEYDMADTEWDELSNRLDQTHGAVSIFEKDKILIKNLVPTDAKTATTEKSNWIATRAKNYRLTLRKKTERELA